MYFPRGRAVGEGTVRAPRASLYVALSLGLVCGASAASAGAFRPVGAFAGPFTLGGLLHTRNPAAGAGISRGRAAAQGAVAGISMRVHPPSKFRQDGRLHGPGPDSLSTPAAPTFTQRVLPACLPKPSPIAR